MYIMRVSELIISDTFGDEHMQSVIDIIGACQNDYDGSYKFHYLMYKLIEISFEYMNEDDTERVERLYEIFKIFKSRLDVPYMVQIGSCYIQFSTHRIPDKELYINYCSDMYNSGIKFTMSFILRIPKSLSHFINL